MRKGTQNTHHKVLLKKKRKRERCAITNEPIPPLKKKDGLIRDRGYAVSFVFPRSPSSFPPPKKEKEERGIEMKPNIFDQISSEKKIAKSSLCRKGGVEEEAGKGWEAQVKWTHACSWIQSRKGGCRIDRVGYVEESGKRG